MAENDKRTALLDAVERIRPTLEAYADEAQAARTLPQPAWKALHDAGLFRLKAPATLGGTEADPVVQVEVIEAVTRIDTSAGWTLMVGAGTLAIVSGWLQEAGVAAFMVDGRLPRVAGGLMPTGRATPVAGGFRVSGRWQFGSGARHAEWFAASCVVEGADPPQTRFFCFPASEVRIHDTWFVGGLQGTGSEDFEVTDAFVPESLVFDSTASAVRGGPLFRIGLPGLVVNEHAAFALGVGRRALDEMCEIARTKSRGYVAPQGVAARQTFQNELGRCDVALRAARAHVLASMQAAWEHVQASGEACPPAAQLDLRAAATYATDVARDVCRRMFRFAGARSLFSGNVLERCLRDVDAAAQHMMVSDESYEGHAQALLGFTDLAPIH